MRNSLAIVTITICLLLSVSLPAQAARYGFFLETASGLGDAEWDSDTYDWDIDTEQFAFGLAIDGDPSPDQPFSLRVNIGLTNLDIEDDNHDTLESDGIYSEVLFTFSPIRTDQMRWWLGPLFRIGYYHGEGDGFNVDVDFTELGVGVATGFNIDMGAVIVSPSIGWRTNSYSGRGRLEDGFHEDWSGNASSIFFNLATFF